MKSEDTDHDDACEDDDGDGEQSIRQLSSADELHSPMLDCRETGCGDRREREGRG